MLVDAQPKPNVIKDEQLVLKKVIVLNIGQDTQSYMSMVLTSNNIVNLISKHGAYVVWHNRDNGFIHITKQHLQVAQKKGMYIRLR